MLKERSYSVLVVSASENFIKMLKQNLSSAKYNLVKYTSSISSAKRANVEKLYDIVIIDTPLPDGTGDSFAVDISSNQASIVMMLVHYDLYTQVHDNYANHGLFIKRKSSSSYRISRSIGFGTMVSDGISSVKITSRTSPFRTGWFVNTAVPFSSSVFS